MAQLCTISLVIVFMLPLHKDAELAPRDVVARGIFEEVKQGRGAFLDCTKAVGETFKDQFPTVFGYCQDAGIDPAKDRIPVIPAAHYFMGGILTDVNGRTSLDGLWACGEVTSTGAHGANRLASNSLLEAVVFAARIAEDIQDLLPESKVNLWAHESLPHDETFEPPEDTAMMTLLRQTMSAEFGVVRTPEGMLEGLKTILKIEEENQRQRFENNIITAKMIAVSALLRKESRGGHYRTDFDEENPNMAKRSYISFAQTNRIALELVGKTSAKSA